MKFYKIVFVLMFVTQNALSSASCQNGYDVLSNVSSNTFVAPVNGACQFNGYSLITISDYYKFIYTGFISGDEISLCTDGHMSDGSCVQYASGDCINGYYDADTDTNTFSELTNDNCSSPYAKFTKTTRCDHNPGDTCVDLPTPIVSLTWDDGNGNTTSGTCVYEENITLPTPPTRTGYDFAGWLVQ